MLEQKNIPAGAIQIIKTLQKSQHQAYLVGGCIRDLLQKTPPPEWDITTSALPKEIMHLFPNTISTGIDYGTVTVVMDDGQYEVTTFRSDERYVDGRHPSNVRFTEDLHQDLSRRDFTINALAYDPHTDKLIDDYQGQKDLGNQLIRAIGNPIDRFSEDGLRPIRACRFAAKLGFKIEAATFTAIPKTLHIVEKVALERVHDELIKLLLADKPSVGFELMRQSGLLKLFIPELAACYGIDQPPEYHKYDVYWHSLHACDAAPKENILLRLAALLHDIEKPACKVDYTYYGHDQEGAATVKQILTRLKFSRADTEKVVHLISQHMFNYTSDWGDAAVRRFIRRVGLENIPDLFALRRADTQAMEREIGDEYLIELQKRIDKIIAEQNALHLSDLMVNGNDIMQLLNIPPGPKVGEVLSGLLEKVLDDPSLNQREKLLELARQLIQT